MWIQHPRLGAFSVVLADDSRTGQPDPQIVMIRARREEHLALLARAYPSLGAYPVLRSSPQHDYPFRLVVPKSIAAGLVSHLLLTLDYRNVKDCAHVAESSVGRGFVQALHVVWSALRRIQ
jgi:hypothetical protein